MGVYIKGMEMPTSCLSCPLQGGTADCRLTQKTYNWGLSERPSDCPLVPVLKHGRLIDADVLMEDVRQFIKENMLSRDDARELLEMIDDAPTVIPEDGKDTDVPTREEET